MTTVLNHQGVSLRPNPARVVVRPFKPATEPRDLNPTDKTRANHIVDRVLALDPVSAEQHLAEVLLNFQGRHRNLLQTFEARADDMEDAFATHDTFTQAQRRLVGAYFLHEYSFEAAALFNPSIVAHPDQSDAPPGGLRFILSLRAVGRRACLVADVPFGNHPARWVSHARPDCDAGGHSKGAEPRVRGGRR